MFEVWYHNKAHDERNYHVTSSAAYKEMDKTISAVEKQSRVKHVEKDRVEFLNGDFVVVRDLSVKPFTSDYE